MDIPGQGPENCFFTGLPWHMARLTSQYEL